MMNSNDRFIAKTKTAIPILHPDGSFGQALLIQVLVWDLSGRQHDCAAYRCIVEDDSLKQGEEWYWHRCAESGQKLYAEEAIYAFPSSAHIIKEKWRR